MNLFIENMYLIPFILVPLILSILYWFSKTYQEFKIEESKKIHLIYLELTSEKNIEHQLKETSLEIEKLENSIKNKLLIIKVAVFNIDFTLKEIF